MKQLMVIGVAATLAAAGLGCQGRGDATAAPRARRAERAPAASHVATPAPASAAAAKRHLRYGCGSVDELMTKLFAALEAKDLQGMANLRVTRQEHDDLLWPEFDAKDHNVQPDFAWDMLNRRSHVGAGRAIGDYGGQELTLLGVEFTRGIERYPSFVLHRGTIVHARTPAGDILDLMFCGSVLELDGQFKLLSYRD